jgi:Tol biopolymer transport system component
MSSEDAPFSFVCVCDADGANERVVLATPRHLEAPNWSPDGTYLLLNGGGRLWRLPLPSSELAQVNTGSVTSLNNDHGISPDGATLVISAGPMYALPADGGEPRRLTEKTPSYYHGWSPDGGTLAYCAQRDGVFNLYAIPAEGGAEETRLTFGAGYDDGPDYSPDGRWVYFNSNRGGKWCVWRIPAAGSGGPGDPLAEQVTSDDWDDWFPHPSPDGCWLVFLSYPPGTKGHPAGKDVLLRRLPLPGPEPGAATAEPETIARLYGGQGTINVNSWSPDGARFAYVRYARPE